MTPETISLAKILWDYHHLNQRVEKSDCIMVLGSHDIRVADRGIDLRKEGYAPKILFSGGLGRLTDSDPAFLGTTEADRFAQRAREREIPEEHILIENTSTNTGENIKNSFLLLKDLALTSIILVQKPYMERRTFATFAKQWPGADVRFCVTSPQISFEDYATEEISTEKFTDIMVGDMQRIIDYPAKGFQIPQDVPADVLAAYETLIALGFTESLV